jgi:aromatase
VERHFDIRTEDTLHVSAARSAVFDALWDPTKWQALTRHVKQVKLLQNSPVFQRFEMLIADGEDEYNVVSERHCVPDHTIRYRQTRPPILLRDHEGEWLLEEENQKTAVTLRHFANLDAERCRARWKTSSDEEIRALVANVLRTNGLATMRAVFSALRTI